MNENQKYMRQALTQAKKAYENGEVPIGAVIVYNGKVIARAYNKRNASKIATKHAEILAIEKACKKLGDWRLDGAEMFVTLEPCPMCAGAIVNSRIDRVVYGASDSVAGCLGSVINFNSYPFNHAFEVVGGVLDEECTAILQAFFENKRKKKREEAKNEK